MRNAAQNWCSRGCFASFGCVSRRNEAHVSASGRRRCTAAAPLCMGRALSTSKSWPPCRRKRPRWKSRRLFRWGIAEYSRTQRKSRRLITARPAKDSARGSSDASAVITAWASAAFRWAASRRTARRFQVGSCDRSIICQIGAWCQRGVSGSAKNVSMENRKGLRRRCCRAASPVSARRPVVRTLRTVRYARRPARCQSRCRYRGHRKTAIPTGTFCFLYSGCLR